MTWFLDRWFWWAIALLGGVTIRALLLVAVLAAVGLLPLNQTLGPREVYEEHLRLLDAGEYEAAMQLIHPGCGLDAASAEDAHEWYTDRDLTFVGQNKVTDVFTSEDGTTAVLTVDIGMKLRAENEELPPALGQAAVKEDGEWLISCG